MAIQSVDGIGKDAKIYRARLKGGPQVWRILLLLLLTTFAWLCLQNSRNLGTTFYPSPVQI